jgi:hypothetical protein
MLTVFNIPCLGYRQTVMFDSPVCSKNLSSDIIGPGSGRFIVGKIFGQQAKGNISGEHGRQK